MRAGLRSPGWPCAGLVVVALVAAAGAAEAESRPAVVVTPGSAHSYSAAVQRFADLSSLPTDSRVDYFRRTLEESLAFSSVFRIIGTQAFLGPETTASLDDSPPPVCSDWTQVGADALVQGELVVTAERFSAEFVVWDLSRCTRLERKSYSQALEIDAGVLAKRIADDVVAAFVGLPGVASTEIAFVSNRGGNPEVYVMSADGTNPRAATANRSINNFPSWSPSGESIIYTSYREGNRPRLYLSTRGRGRPGRLLAKLGMEMPQYTGVFDPAGKRLAVVMAKDGDSEIYTARPDGRSSKRLTRNRSIDVSPDWSPDGSQIVFVSDRSGSPQIYVMDAGGGNVRRLTYNGSYNTNPDWSPDGRWIAYESRVQGQFDIWLIDPEGTVNVPLVTHPRSDESPTWAPNSRKLGFSSTRRGRSDIYLVDANGENLRRITQGKADSTSPNWGPFPR